MNNLYIDESGNTGEILSKDSKFNFTDQPYYVLAGILLDENSQVALSAFINSQITKHRIQGNELKAKNLYDSKPAFISELVEYIVTNKIPFFIELMDKHFYLHVQLVDYFIVPYYSLPINDENIFRKRFIASTLGQFLNQNIYQSFINAVKENTSESLENFYDILITYFEQAGHNEIKINVEQTKIDYLERKAEDPDKALNEFFPIPDENPNKKLIHLLPNFNAFTNLVARTQKYVDDNSTNKKIEIIHDEQKQFDIIFQSALEQMKNVETDKLVEKTHIKEKGRFNIDNNIKLNFKDSKTDILIQVSDLIAGVIMRFWVDFISKNEAKTTTYLPIIKKLNYPYDKTTVGINYVVPDFNHTEIITRIKHN
jgi:hypothetical protein